ncbi:MAG: DsbE family thiol:disulfide interchange protein [Rhodospirillaceae bacterium]|nr:DsbE family thiol:disulfide interchange protein [Rhodospirillaceae bacterium]
MSDNALTAPAPRRRLVFLLPIAVMVALVAVFGKRLMDVSGGNDPHLIPTVLLDTPMPDLDLPPLPGRTKLTDVGQEGDGLSDEDLKGRVSLVNVWGSWCAACQVEHPLLMELAKRDEVPIHGIAWRDDPAAALAWLARHGDPYTRIGQDPRSHAAIALGVTGAPETFVVDADGVIRYKHIGPITPEAWTGTLRPLIKQLSARP